MEDAEHSLEAELADARTRSEAAEREGSTYVAGWHSARAGQALLHLGRPAEALGEFERSAGLLALVRAQGVQEIREMLFVTAQYVNSGQALPTLPDLEAWVALGRASCLVALARWAEASEAVDRARPLVKGWGRGQMRKALDAIADEVARGSGTSQEALDALGRRIAATDTDATARLQARYERAVLLREQGRAPEAMREALTLVRDADAAGDDWVVAGARQVLGAVLIDTGSTAEGVATLALAFDGFAQVGADQAVAGAAPGLAWQYSSMGEHARAAEVLRRGIAAADSMLRSGDGAGIDGVRVNRVDLLTSLGSALDACGDREGALSAFESAVSAADAIGDSVRAADARHGEAIVRLGDGTDAAAAVDALAELDAARAAYEAAGLAERAAGCLHESAALLARLGSYDAAAGRYTAAREAYLAMPEVLRDTGSWPDEVGDCEANLALLAAMASDPTTAVDSGAFRSGGHRMRHGSA